eukprot:jgi/Astpho2/6352/Aster-x0725
MVAEGMDLAPQQPRASMPSVAGTVGALSRMLTGMVTMGAYRAVLGCAKPTASVATEPPPRTQVAVDIKPLQQLDSIVHVDTDLSMAEVQAAVECTTRIPPSRQALMVCEERRRSDGLSSSLGAQLQHFAKQLGSREEAYKMVLGCTKFVLLSEALNREVSGRGLLGLLKCSVAERLKDASSQGMPGLSLRVYTMQGQTFLLEVDPEASLSNLQKLVFSTTGVRTQHQRLVVEEKEAPTALTHLSNNLLLTSYNSLRAATGLLVQGKSRLGQWLRGDVTFPLSVTLQTGQSLRTVQLRVTGDMTLDQLQQMAAIEAERIVPALPGITAPTLPATSLTGLVLPGPSEVPALAATAYKPDEDDDSASSQGRGQEQDPRNITFVYRKQQI